MSFAPLTREDVISVIEGKGKAKRIPNLVHLWVHPKSFGDDQQNVEDILASYPLDAQRIMIGIPEIYSSPEDAPEYRWASSAEPEDDKDKAIDERVVIEDWNQLDDILAKFPDPEYAGMFPDNPLGDGRYRLGQWFFCLFERLWSLRGMTNALMDFYLYPDEIHRLFDALTTFYCRVIERAGTELDVDGIFTSDDLGTQDSTFFGLDVFDEFFAPYYKRIIDTAHANNIHFWLHTCGNISQFIPRFIDLKLDVLHPIQKYTIDEVEAAKMINGKMCIWAGFDVQQIIPWGTVEDVRNEVRFMIDTYYRPEGRLMITAGNGINEDCPLPSLEALLDETTKYGLQKCSD
jgi:uroporphyrinogen decarboxylase